MQNTSAHLLEFDLLRELVRGYAASDLGRARVQALAPSPDLAWIRSQQELTAEIREFRRAGGTFNFSGLLDVSKILEQSRISGVVLGAEEICSVITVIDRGAEWREIAFHPPQGIKGDWSAVQELSSGMADFSPLLKAIRGKILPDGRLDDRASPQLASIRREIEKQRRAIQDSLRGYLRRLSEGGSAQDDLVTVRGERFVVPVKVEQKRRVPGVVHGASSSGQTVFIEPLETIEQNNELVRLHEDELAEVRRILLEMTQRIGEQAAQIAAAQEVLAELELQFAKAMFADDYNCVTPELSRDSRSFILRDARHPLLERNLRLQRLEVVPISVELEGDRRQLIITGPNTGGKTVTLKIIGLLSLMAQSGIPVPASRMELPGFDAILADIGDYQSIEQNLSTFSAHVTNMDFISRIATSQSLILLDELGSATDPEEGAALAVAIADYFLKIGCITAISTHHTSLKVFGANSPGVLNAAVGLDEATLKPTYELKTGVPGASAGINTAQRLGLNPEIVRSARLRLGTQARDVGQFLDQLHQQLKAAESERLRLRTKEDDLNRERARLASEGKREQQEKVRELEKKLESLLRDFEYHAREAVNAVQDRAAAQKLSKDAERRIAKLRRDFREQFDSVVVAHVSGADRGDPNAAPQLVKHISQGDVVKLKSMGRNAKVVRKLDDDHFEVEVGAMKMRIAREDVAEVLVRASETPVHAARAKGVSISLQLEDINVPSEINVIGHTVDDATREVEKFVDRAFLAGLPRIRVVHGSGMGILRKALRQFLQKHPHVESVAEPPQNEGGGGATVAELKV
ncbi:MAG TPA: endonuclease MutS2 [Terriglobales bacterium]|jgi:DNA mismatch repair protein MutS2|nr:endonuclease MutS2 [Terriglobales bacterium]